MLGNDNNRRPRLRARLRRRGRRRSEDVAPDDDGAGERRIDLTRRVKPPERTEGAGAGLTEPADPKVLERLRSFLRDS